MARSLTIRQLSASGELLRVVTCPAGVVSVFRAATSGDLKPFQRALAGIQGPERFVIELDREPYEAYQHVLVGYAEHFTDEQQSVRSYLSTCGVPQAGLDALLHAYGLAAHSESPIRDLPPAEARMVQLLSATHCGKKLLILNDPLEPLSMHWRERFAELLAAFAVREGAIVVVPALSTRPSAWIANEAIHRIEISVDSNRTIGFSTQAPAEIRDLIEQVRAEARTAHSRRSAASLGDDVALKPAQAPSRPVPPPQRVTSQQQFANVDTKVISTPAYAQILLPLFSLPLSRRLSAFADRLNRPIHITPKLAAASLAATTLLIAVFIRHSENAKIPTAAVQTEDQQKPADASVTVQPTQVVTAALHNQPLLEGVTGEQTPLEQEAPPQLPSAVAPLSTAAIQSDKLLDLYPSNIKESVVKVFKGINPNMPPATTVTEEAPEAVKRRNAGELLQLLERASTNEGASTENRDGVSAPSVAGQPNYPPPFSATQNGETQSWEERREMMRQRFLESIRAASNQ